MFLVEKFSFMEAQKWAIDRLPEFPVTSAADLPRFFDVCQSVFVAQLLADDVYLKDSRFQGLYKVSLDVFSRISSNRFSVGDIKIKAEIRKDKELAFLMTRAKPPQGSKVFFDFTVCALEVGVDDTPHVNAFTANWILKGKTEVVKADGTPYTAVMDNLKLIDTFCSIAVTDPASFAEKAKACLDTKNAADKRAAVKLRKTELETTLDAAVAADDEEEIARISGELDEINATKVGVRANANAQQRADTARTNAVKDILAIERRELDFLRTEDEIRSFILGWMARHIKFICAYVPYTIDAKGRTNRSYLKAFQRDFPESDFIDEVSMSDITSGIKTPRPAPRPGYYSVPKLGVKGELVNRDRLFVTCFDPKALRDLPVEVRIYLEHQWSNETHEYVKVQSHMQSVTLALDLYRSGFPIGVVDGSVVTEVRRCAPNPEMFDIGYDWPDFIPPAIAEEPTPDPMDDNYDFYDFESNEFPEPTPEDED